MANILITEEQFNRLFKENNPVIKKTISESQELYCGVIQLLQEEKGISEDIVKNSEKLSEIICSRINSVITNNNPPIEARIEYQNGIPIFHDIFKYIVSYYDDIQKSNVKHEINIHVQITNYENGKIQGKYDELNNILTIYCHKVNGQLESYQIYEPVYHEMTHVYQVLRSNKSRLMPYKSRLLYQQAQNNLGFPYNSVERIIAQSIVISQKQEITANAHRLYYALMQDTNNQESLTYNSALFEDYKQLKKCYDKLHEWLNDRTAQSKCLSVYNKKIAFFYYRAQKALYFIQNELKRVIKKAEEDNLKKFNTK